ncbi:hypothetical protein TNCT_663431 [Trichonephila clavata]|uniref:Uncharacterized protein n=1 Tax=Trichonephila clavata TaxID=2740835 RepID=A0A8X6FLT2_TRICU|nr:hypothetical protein TNCT_663431 [Trichonephila clavata]
MPYPRNRVRDPTAADDASLQSHLCSSKRSLSRDFLSGCSASCSALKPFLDPLAGRRTLSERGPSSPARRSPSRASVLGPLPKIELYARALHYCPFLSSASLLFPEACSAALQNRLPCSSFSCLVGTNICT